MGLITQVVARCKLCSLTSRCAHPDRMLCSITTWSADLCSPLQEVHNSDVACAALGLGFYSCCELSPSHLLFKRLFAVCNLKLNLEWTPPNAAPYLSDELANSVSHLYIVSDNNLHLYSFLASPLLPPGSLLSGSALSVSLISFYYVSPSPVSPSVTSNANSENKSQTYDIHQNNACRAVCCKTDFLNRITWQCGYLGLRVGEASNPGPVESTQNSPANCESRPPASARSRDLRDMFAAALRDDQAQDDPIPENPNECNTSQTYDEQRHLIRQAFAECSSLPPYLDPAPSLFPTSRTPETHWQNKVDTTLSLWKAGLPTCK
jgi:hypothetical protein